MDNDNILYVLHSTAEGCNVYVYEKQVTIAGKDA